LTGNGAVFSPLGEGYGIFEKLHIETVKFIHNYKKMIEEK